MTNERPTNQHNSPKRIKQFFITVFCVFFIIASINLWIDPSGIFFNRDRIIEPRSSTAWLPMKLVIDRKEECHNFIFGTSRIYSWDTTPLREKTCKFSYPAKALQSFHSGLNTLINHQIKINNVIITVERAAFYNQEQFGYKKSAALGLDYPSNLMETVFAIKTLLYTNTHSNIQKYFSEPIESEYQRENFQKSDERIFRQLIYRWEPEFKNVKWKTSQEHTDAVNSAKAYSGVDLYRNYEPLPAINLLKKINGLSKKHNFKVTYIRAPIFIKNIVATNKTEFFDAYRRLANTTPYYDFSYDINYLKKPSLWIDYSHYKKGVAELIINDLNKKTTELQFGKYITKNNVDIHLAQFEKNIYKYFIDLKPYPPNTVIHSSWLKQPTH